MICNIITQEAPETVVINGICYPINWDFRIGIAFDSVRDSDIPDGYKLLKMLRLYYPHIPSNIPSAVEKIKWFYRCGEEDEESKDEKKTKRYVRKTSNEPAYSLSQDAAYIYAAFLEQYGIDLAAIDSLHWWKFMALFESLGEDTKMSKIMYYRKANTSGMPKERRAYINEMKKLYKIKDASPGRKMSLEDRNRKWKEYVKERHKIMN